MNSKTGLIFLPGFFGYSYSFHHKVKELIISGFDVISFDAYEGQSIKRPPFFSYILKNSKAFDKLVESLNDDITISNIQKACDVLIGRGCKKVVVLGYGLGGVYSLLSARKVRGLTGVVAWYPHLIYPENFRKPPPDINNLNLPLLIFFGNNDNRLDSRTIDFAKRLEFDNKNLSLQIFPNASHAFAEKFIQGLIPNPYYKKSASKKSWGITIPWIMRL